MTSRIKVKLIGVLIKVDENFNLKIALQKTTEEEVDSFSLPNSFLDAPSKIETGLDSLARNFAGQYSVVSFALDLIATKDETLCLPYCQIFRQGLVEEDEFVWEPLEDILEFLELWEMKVVDNTLKAIAVRATMQPIAFYFLPEIFTLTAVQRIHSTLWDQELDRRNFRRRVEKSNLLVQVGVQEKVKHRPGRLYKLDLDWQNKISTYPDLKTKTKQLS